MPNKLCLGTVQFGLKYGIKNEIGRQPTNEESFSVINTAIEKGITSFDTASLYGDAEEILGEFGIGKYSVKIISKLKSNIEDEKVEDEVKASLRHLKVNYLDGYLLHEAQDFYKLGIIKRLQSCKEKGLVRNIGVSVYEPEDALNVVKSGVIDYIQIPYNIFDQRLNETDFFEIAKKNSITVFARSSFLQGLLLMEIKKLPSYLVEAKPYLKKFNEIIADYGYSKNEAAFLFSYCHKGIDKVVFGVETREQLQKNMEIIKKVGGFKECYSRLFGKFKNIKREIIIPSLWNLH